MNSEQPLFNRTQLLLGPLAMDSIRQKRVILFGIGGVGSWCAESLIRTGIRELTIVDSDVVCASNINRQLMATTQTVGQPKVEVLKERLLLINPDAHINTRQEVFCESSAASFHIEDYDYAIDAIDSLPDKQLLILMATRCKSLTFFSSMGAALKLDASRIRVAEFWKVTGDPLARALRNRFKKSKQLPARKFLCVYSDELLANKGQNLLDEPNPFKKQTNGSLAHITAIFGFTLAGLVIQDIVKKTSEE